MTLAGTRPPTLDEWEKYELHHRARLAIKPGMIYLLAAINGIIFVLLICQMFLSEFNMQFLQFVGENTLHIYCLHGLILPFLKKGYHILVNRIKIVDISVVLQVIIAMIAMLICMLIIGEFQKISGIFGMKCKMSESDPMKCK